MSVPPVNSATNTPQNGSGVKSPSKQSLDYDAFLKLLVAEMKHQDPTNPSDPAQYLGQLAAFSNVEQAMKTNSKLDALMGAMAVTQADAVIGRTVTSADGTITGKVVSLRVLSDGALAKLDNGKELVLGPGVTVS